uniref:Uncharacterized protein n=1 Tax=viral metagenome TaxID=1070528 RepID=A0A6H1ZFG1_9ZZZZ
MSNTTCGDLGDGQACEFFIHDHDGGGFCEKVEQGHRWEADNACAPVRALLECRRERDRYREALDSINTHRNIQYPNEETAGSSGDRLWQIGFTDGVRDCVKIARAAMPTDADKSNREAFGVGLKKDKEE